MMYFCATFRTERYAEIAQLVEHNLAKVGVASSSLVFRSKGNLRVTFFLFPLRENFAAPRGKCFFP